jgi:hypothetical protein
MGRVRRLVREGLHKQDDVMEKDPSGLNEDVPPIVES